MSRSQTIAQGNLEQNEGWVSDMRFWMLKGKGSATELRGGCTNTKQMQSYWFVEELRNKEVDLDTMIWLHIYIFPCKWNKVINRGNRILEVRRDAQQIALNQ